MPTKSCRKYSSEGSKKWSKVEINFFPLRVHSDSDQSRNGDIFYRASIRSRLSASCLMCIIPDSHSDAAVWVL